MRIELIRVRSSMENTRRLLGQIPSKLELLKKIPGIKQVLELSHANFPCDLAIILIWDQPPVTTRSREGLVLAEYLSDFGLIEHSVWNQVKTEKSEDGF